MREEMKNHAREENKYIKLLESNQQFKMQGWDKKSNKKVVGIIEGDPKEYRWYKDHLAMRYFDTWREAYEQLMD